MFPKKGKVFPSAIAAGLRKQLGDTHQAVKTVMKWTGANERTVKNWLAGANGPSGEHLIHLFRNSDEVFDAFLCLAGREHAVVAKKLVTTRDALAEAIELIDKVLEDTSRGP
jgi:hypothetical protein